MRKMFMTSLDWVINKQLKSKLETTVVILSLLSSYHCFIRSISSLQICVCL